MAPCLRDIVIGRAKVLFSPEAQAWIMGQQRKRRLQWPPSGAVNFGDLRRAENRAPWS